MAHSLLVATSMVNTMVDLVILWRLAFGVYAYKLNVDNGI
jgi:hypothetical protein